MRVAAQQDGIAFLLDTCFLPFFLFAVVRSYGLAGLLQCGSPLPSLALLVVTTVVPPSVLPCNSHHVIGVSSTPRPARPHFSGVCAVPLSAHVLLSSLLLQSFLMVRTPLFVSSVLDRSHKIGHGGGTAWEECRRHRRHRRLLQQKPEHFHTCPTQSLQPLIPASVKRPQQHKRGQIKRWCGWGGIARTRTPQGVCFVHRQQPLTEKAEARKDIYIYP